MAHSPIIVLEVHQDGQCIASWKLGAGTWTLGRNKKADLQINIAHISRIHLTLGVDHNRVWVRDENSRFGILVNQRPKLEADIMPGDIVQLVDLQLSYRMCAHRSDSNAGTLPNDWEEYNDTNPEYPTQEPENSQHRTQHSKKSRASVLNALTANLDAAAHENTQETSVDHSDDIDSIRPPVPPLLVRLHHEANSLLHGGHRKNVAVEVITALGHQIHDVALLTPGEHYWWGGTPRFPFLARETGHQFMMVDHLIHGAYRVRAPSDPRWHVFYRGAQPLAVHRTGPYITCAANHEDQVEISSGPFTVYVRCVNPPKRIPKFVQENFFKPRPSALAALALSLVIHATALGFPRPRTPLEHHAQRIQASYATVTLANEPPTQRKEKKPPPKFQPPPKKPMAHNRTKRAALPNKTRSIQQQSLPKTDPTFQNATPTPATEQKSASTQQSRINVTDFKIQGLMGHLPKVQLTGRPSNRSTLRSVTRHGVGNSFPIVSKNTDDIHISPTGTLTHRQVAKAINRYTPMVFRCYRTLLETYPDAEGRVDFTWTVLPNGRVRDVQLALDDVGSAQLIRCITRSIGIWVFPRPDNGQATVYFPFRFMRPKL